MKKQELAKRMYFLTMYNISGRQCGIQAGHAALRFARANRNKKEMWDFVDHHETWVILSGGGSEDMKEYFNKMKELGMKPIPFFEPDLNGSMSAICMGIFDERYFDKKYDFDTYLLVAQGKEETTAEKEARFKKWIKEDLGGYDVYDIRTFLKSLKLATN